jgi:hypothetical protein
MAAERLIALQAEIEAKQREVERIIAEEAKKNTVPPLIDALEEVVSTQAFANDAFRDFHEYTHPGRSRGARPTQDSRAEEENLKALMYETRVAHDAAKDKMLKALLDQAREDAKTKCDNANMFETLFAQMRALQARVTTLEEEKVVKDRLAEETIRSHGYSTGY